MFHRHKKSICSKRRSYQYLLGDWLYGGNFLLRNGTLLDLKKQNTLFANFLCYVMQFINLSNNKSDATSQLGYIPLSLFSQIC